MVVGLVQRMVVALARKQFAQPLLELVRSSQCILVLGMELELGMVLELVYRLGMELALVP